jgi:hypothetical protein
VQRDGDDGGVEQDRYPADEHGPDRAPDGGIDPAVSGSWTRYQVLRQLCHDLAVERGEVDPAKLTPRVRSVALDLFRHELLMTHRAVPDDVLASIVDEIVLPLVRPR